MTQEQKDLLLKDLCSRLPYGVKVRYSSYEKFITCTLQAIDYVYNNVDLWSKDACFNPVNISKIKPYLFPLSSMTEEQYNEMQTISGKDCMEHMEIEKEWRNNSPFTHLPLYQHRVIEFFHKYHFDYRGLIPMGLAIDATGKNIY